MKKIICVLLAVIMFVSIIPFSAIAEGEEEYYNDKYLAALADSSYTRKIEKYDGYHFVVGTKAVWDCKLYTLSATVVSLSKNIATFSISFKSKIPEPYCTLEGWYGYHIHASSNLDSNDFFPSDKKQLRVNVAKNDVFSESAAAGGMQFIKIRIEKTAKESNCFPLDPENKYTEDILKNRKTDANGIYIEDTYALGYYVKPTYKWNLNTIKASAKAIALGTYAFNGVVYYKGSSDTAAKQKAVVKNKSIVLSGLKPGTPYSIKLVCKVPFTDPETKQKKYTMDIVGKVISVTTSLTSKPLLKQVKVYGVKYGKYTRKGYWETRSTGGYVWHPAETFYTAKYKVRVSLRNVPARAKGLYLKSGGYSAYQAGRKGTYTFSMTYQSKKSVKGKKLSCNLYYSSNTINKSAVGLSPARRITYRIKNSTVKYKK